MLRAGWVVPDDERRSRGQVYHLQPIPTHLNLELVDNGFEDSLNTACLPASPSRSPRFSTLRLCGFGLPWRHIST